MKRTKTYTLAIYFLLLATGLTFSSCGDDDEEIIDDQTGGTITLDDVNDGQGEAVTTGDAIINFLGSTTWDQSTNILFNGTEYERFYITLDGANDDYVEVRLVQAVDNSTISGPESGTYTLGSSMQENTVSLEFLDDRYFFSTTSSGTVEVSREGDQVNIVLEASDLELAGGDDLINLNMAAKATPQ